MKHLVRAALACAVALTVSPALAAPSIAVEDVVAMCRAGFAPTGGQAPSMAQKRLCAAYLDAVVATTVQFAALAQESGTKPPFCVPPEADYETLSAAFLTFADANPQHARLAGAALVVAAFADRYPCR